MMQHEKDRILALLRGKDRWCQHAEARDGRGHAVHYNDPAAVSWDLTGAVCVLFGWARALELFAQLERQIVGRRSGGKHPSGLQNNDPEIRSMVAVQEYNDQADTTYELVMARLEALSVYIPESRPQRSGPAWALKDPGGPG